MASSSYARIAGLQSEVGRVVVTRVAGSEVDYKRQISMYRKDMTVSVNNIRREQIKMRRKIGKYVKKLKQTRIENVKRVEEERRRDEERALLEALHLRLKAEAAAARIRRYSRDIKEPIKETETGTNSVDSGIDEPLSPSQVQFKEGPIFFETPQKAKFANAEDSKLAESKSDVIKLNHASVVKENKHYATVLPMINEELEKEGEEEEQSDTVFDNTDSTDLLTVDETRVTDDELSVSSFGRKRPKKKEISFSDIIKLKYRSTQQMFDLVHVLAKRHGIPDIEEKVPDPRDNIVHRGTTGDTYGSFRLQASVLYPMKYGYVTDKETEHAADETVQVFPAVNVTSPSLDSEGEDGHTSRTEGRKLSLEERQQLFLSGKYSRSTDNSSGTSSQQSILDESRPKLKSKDNTLPLLVEKVNRVKLNQRAMSDSENNYALLSPTKPSSSRSSRSLPPLNNNKSSAKHTPISWTEAFGLIRAIRSLDDI